MAAWSDPVGAAERKPGPAVGISGGDQRWGSAVAAPHAVPNDSERHVGHFSKLGEDDPRFVRCSVRERNRGEHGSCRDARRQREARPERAAWRGPCGDNCRDTCGDSRVCTCTGLCEDALADRGPSRGVGHPRRPHERAREGGLTERLVQRGRGRCQRRRRVLDPAPERSLFDAVDHARVDALEESGLRKNRRRSRRTAEQRIERIARGRAVRAERAVGLVGARCGRVAVPQRSPAGGSDRWAQAHPTPPIGPSRSGSTPARDASASDSSRQTSRCG